MTQVKRAFSYLGVGKDIGNTGKMAHRAEPQIYLGQAGKGIDPLFVEGLFSVGRPINMPDFTKNIDVEKIKAGYPKNYLYSIPIGEEKEIKFTVDHFKPYLAMQLLLGDVAISPNKASTGQTTVASSPTKTSATLTSATGIAVNDWCLVDTVHATYGGFPEIAIINSVNGNAVTFEGLTSAPAVGATFEKLKGSTTGTNKANTGIYLPESLTVNFQVYHAVFVMPLVGSKSSLVISIPELEIKPEQSMPNFNENLSKLSFAGMARTQGEKSFTLTDGTTELRPWSMEAWWIPYEAA
jgi:hypothetical protein